MIGEKVRNPKKSASKASRIGGLADYVRAPERQSRQEKCLYYGARGFLTDTPTGHRAEMIALAQDAVRSADPVNHYVLSWRQGEEPTADQVEQAVDLVLDELGLTDHQALYGLHGNTDNIHLHIVVNRVHPVTERVVKINGGFDIEALHRAVARVEHAQSWQPEARARYGVEESGEVVRQVHEEVGPRPQKTARDIEHRWGHKSAERIAIEEARPVIAAARSWAQLHEGLAERGLRYERVGSGAVVFVGEVPVKASSVAREAGFGRLQKRLGGYEPPAESLDVRAREVLVATRPEHPEWPLYRKALADYRQGKGETWGRLRQVMERERGELRERHLERRKRVLAGDWKGKGELLNALRQALAQEQRAERTAMRRRHGEARAAVSRHFGPAPTFKAWLKEQGRDAAAEQWRQRPPAAALVIPTQGSWGTPDGQYRQFVASWSEARAAREVALERLAERHGREVAELRRATRRRWAAARMMMKGRAAAALWAMHARQANQRDWRALSERQRREQRLVAQAYRPPDWSAWLTARVAQGDREAAAALRRAETADKHLNQEKSHAGRARRDRPNAESAQERRGVRGVARSAHARGRHRSRLRKPDAAFPGADPAAGPAARVRALSELALVRLGEIPHLLLPRHARRDLEEPRTQRTDRGVRRGDGRLRTRSKGRARGR